MFAEGKAYAAGRLVTRSGAWAYDAADAAVDAAVLKSHEAGARGTPAQVAAFRNRVRAAQIYWNDFAHILKEAARMPGAIR